MGAFYDRVVLDLTQHINYPKWEYRIYPSGAYAEETAEKGELYLCTDEKNEIAGVYVLNAEPGGTYEDGSWTRVLERGEYLVIHAFAVAPERRGQHIGEMMISYALKKASDEGYQAVRVDVVPGNEPAVRLYRKMGFSYAGASGLGRNHPDIPVFELYEKNEKKEQRKLVKTEHYSIALDGPAGAGKSTIAKSLAGKLSYIYVDTGAMYRALAVYFLEQGLSAADEARISEAVKKAEISLFYRDGQQHVFLNGEDVTARLRKEEVSAMASKTSQYAAVRAHLLSQQQELAKNQNVIMDGRDIGTVVLPNATLKIFLTASSAVRAKRRYEQLQQQGALGSATLETIQAEIEERDYRDSHREHAPLCCAADAVLVDSSEMTAEEVEDRIENLLRERTAD